MGRSERPLGNGDAPVEIFAAELRRLRDQAGNPTYLKMHRACGKIRSKTALSEAAGGDHLATWETVEAYVSALISINKDLEIDQAILRRKWEEAQDQRVRREWAVSPGAPESIVPTTEDEESPLRESRTGTLKLQRLSLRAMTIALGSAGLASALSFVLATQWDHAHAQTGRGGPARPTGPVAVVVQNKVAIGPKGLPEDSTPEYLSTRPVSRCAERGCMVPHTDNMWSGAVIVVTCQTTGAWMTNEDLASKGIAKNPGDAESTQWYRAKLENGVTGYISVVYLKARYRGGMHLAQCR